VTTSLTNPSQAKYGNGTLSSSLPAGILLSVASSGVASFSSIEIDLAGNGYILSFSAPNYCVEPCQMMQDTVSQGFSVIYQLVVTAQPVSGSVAGAVIAPAVVVEVQDADGVSISADSETVVTSALSVDVSKYGTGVLGGVVSSGVVSGSITFGVLDLNSAGNGFVLSFSAPNYCTPPCQMMQSTQTAGFNVVYKLVVLLPPSQAMAGLPIAPGMMISIQRADSVTVTSDSETILSVSLSSVGRFPGGGVLEGTLVEQSVAGVIQFNNVSVSQAGLGYRMEFNAPNYCVEPCQMMQSVQSVEFEIIYKVIISQQPTHSLAGDTIRSTAGDVVLRFQNGENTFVTFSGRVSFEVSR
jgi:hypothetical protein